jgi:hypothetical protein
MKRVPGGAPGISRGALEFVLAITYAASVDPQLATEIQGAKRG